MTGDASAAAVSPDANDRESPDVYEQRAFGFWLYLMSDAIIFALLFATYAVMAFRSDLDPHHDEPGRHQGSERPGDFPLIAPRPLLALSRHCLDRHLFFRVSCRGLVNAPFNHR